MYQVNSVEKPMLPAGVIFEVNGTVKAGVAVLKAMNFHGCVVKDRACSGARVIDPTPHAVTLCCSIRREALFAEQAEGCNFKK